MAGLSSRCCCDLVLKGGITSGVLYPPAIARIAEGFHLVGIGGTSAGAIAACLAAAAEYRRRQGGGMAGFQELERISQEFAGGNLLGLFRPDAATKSRFNLFRDAMGMSQRWFLPRWWTKAKLGWALLRKSSTLRPLMNNGVPGAMGLCTGMANGNRPRAGEIAPLTEWLCDHIDRIAGRPTSADPLTFGDLRRAPLPQGLEEHLKGFERRSIDLRTVTTNLSWCRPMELPLDDVRTLAFDPQEWRQLFPERVVLYLEAEAAKIDSKTLKKDGKLPLPTGDKMPVIVAARLSLSFPLLFTMVPLWAADFEDKQKPLRRLWFSDGGITSNLPVHRFDSLFPRWPTLAINLQYTMEGRDPGRRGVDENGVYMIKRRSDGANDLWSEFDHSTDPVARLVGFAGGVFRSAQVWHDNAFLRLPSFRDRVAEVWLSSKEGGMNLEMDDKAIQELVRRGDLAGRRLRDRFLGQEPDCEVTWDSHRWTRLRSALDGLGDYLHEFAGAVKAPMPGDRPLGDLLVDGAAPDYPFKPAAVHEQARKRIEELLSYIEELVVEAGGHCFDKGPKPSVQIGSRAPF